MTSQLGTLLSPLAPHLAALHLKVPALPRNSVVTPPLPLPMHNSMNSELPYQAKENLFHPPPPPLSTPSPPLVSPPPPGLVAPALTPLERATLVAPVPPPHRATCANALPFTTYHRNRQAPSTMGTALRHHCTCIQPEY